MGLFNFLENVGNKITGAISPKADDLKKEMDSHKLGTDNVTVTIENGKAILTGTVNDQEAYEKAVLAVGNNHGVSTVNTDGLKIAAGNAAESVFYTVQKGDTLWKISETHYGKGKGDKYNIIFEANKPMLTHPDKIYPGQMLRIPPLK